MIHFRDIENNITNKQSSMIISDIVNLLTFFDKNYSSEGFQISQDSTLPVTSKFSIGKNGNSGN